MTSGHNFRTTQKVLVHLGSLRHGGALVACYGSVREAGKLVNGHKLETGMN